MGGTPQGTRRGMFAKLFDWKSLVRSDEVPLPSQHELMRSATDLISCIARDHRGYKRRVCTSAGRPAFWLSNLRAAVQVSCGRDCWWAVPSIIIAIPVSKLFSDAVGNYTSKTVRFRVECDLHPLSTPNTPLLSYLSASSGSTWSPLGTPVMNSGRCSIGNPAFMLIFIILGRWIAGRKRSKQEG